MAGHGGLCRSLVRSRVIASAMGWACALTIAAVSAQDSNIIDLRLQIQWQAPTQCYWKTQLELIDDQAGDSSISEVANRGESKLDGSIQLTDPPNNLLIQPRFSQTGGTAEFSPGRSQHETVDSLGEPSDHRELIAGQPTAPRVNPRGISQHWRGSLPRQPGA